MSKTFRQNIQLLQY